MENKFRKSRLFWRFFTLTFKIKLYWVILGYIGLTTIVSLFTLLSLLHNGLPKKTQFYKKNLPFLTWVIGFENKVFGILFKPNKVKYSCFEFSHFCRYIIRVQQSFYFEEEVVRNASFGVLKIEILDTQAPQLVPYVFQLLTELISNQSLMISNEVDLITLIFQFHTDVILRYRLYGGG